MASKSDKPTTRYWPKTPFPIDEDINNRVILYSDNVELLSAGAIVNPTNETLSHLDYVKNMAGPDLETYVRKKVRSCATGDVRLTPGFNSNFNHIIHAVPPKYQPKYRTAAETALFHTYFRILETMIEKKIRTVVMPLLTTAKCNLPIGENCHLQLRVVRRFLEKKRRQFDRIVIHVDRNDSDAVETYAALFHCYFPKSAEDEEDACYKLNQSIGGPNGEPVIPEREIRIKSKPTVVNDNSMDCQPSGLEISTVVGKTAFSKMRDDLNVNMQASNTRNKGSMLYQIGLMWKFITQGLKFQKI